MKKLKITIFLLLVINKITFSQTKKWNTYELDSIVSIDMPFDVYEIDTIQDFKKTYQIYSYKDSTHFLASKIYLGKTYSNIESITLPIDDQTLGEFYSNLTSILIEGTHYELKHSEPINYNHLQGYKLHFKKKGDTTTIQEANFILVNKNFYSFIYTNSNGINKIDQKKFFDSINFSNSKELIQYPKRSFSFKKILIILLILLFLSFLSQIKSK